MAVYSFETSNGHNSVIKRLRAMNLAPLDSSRQAASFEPKIFEILFFANFAKIFISKEAL
jgi:hypothetical protein